MTRTLASASELHRYPHATRRRLRRAGTLVASAVIAGFAWLIAVPVAGLDLVVGSGPATQSVGLASVVVVPLLAGAVAWGSIALLERLTSRARLIWTIVGCMVLVLSLAGPLSLAAGVGTLATLLIMHVTVGVTLLVGLTWFANPRRRVG